MKPTLKGQHARIRELEQENQKLKGENNQLNMKCDMLERLQKEEVSTLLRQIERYEAQVSNYEACYKILEAMAKLRSEK